MPLVGCLPYLCIPKKRKSLSIENYCDKGGKGQVEINKLFLRRVESIRVKPTEFKNGQPVLIDNVSKRKSKVRPAEPNGLFRQLLGQSKSSKPVVPIVDTTKLDDTELDCESHVSNTYKPTRTSSRIQQRAKETSKHATTKTSHKTHRRPPIDYNHTKKKRESLKTSCEPRTKKSSVSSNRQHHPPTPLKEVIETKKEKIPLRKTVSTAPTFSLPDLQTSNDVDKRSDTRLKHLVKPSVELSVEQSSNLIPLDTIASGKFEMDSVIQESEKIDSTVSTSTIYTASVIESRSDASSLSQWSTTTYPDSDSEPTKNDTDNVTSHLLDSFKGLKTDLSPEKEQSRVKNSPLIKKIETALPQKVDDINSVINRRQSFGVERCLPDHSILTQKHRSYDHLTSYYLINLDKNLNSQISCIKQDSEATYMDETNIKLDSQSSPLEEKPRTIKPKKPLKRSGDTDNMSRFPKTTKTLPVSKQVLRHVTELMKHDNAKKHHIAAKDIESVHL
ncbi:unnamed protein product [Didymodactylos carnosus]|uniref:Uncharacterized protein n=1 Tax=Didymodactylos carnosus TaxID=1234261 RepID=A0A814EQB2_9BILA|nr:unnamed protein product [Didymodactylos carnosus]CAF1273460.1 unnamed protein product [Didymodactylos carnosus]CAF3744171.1 unnamed protein product [Didymodactylos carnosus]CAF4078729.1 unnamed protein product [Didymodactylos carnosus]